MEVKMSAIPSPMPTIHEWLKTLAWNRRRSKSIFNRILIKFSWPWRNNIILQQLNDIQIYWRTCKMSNIMRTRTASPAVVLKK